MWTGRCNLLLAAVLVTAGCGSVRSQAATLGSDVIGAVRDKEPELFEIERRLADSAGAFIGRAVEDKVLARATGVWDTMLLKLNEQTRVVVGRLAQGVERDLNRSLQVMLDENLRLAGSAGRETVNEVVGGALFTVRANVDTLIDTAMDSLEVGLRTKFKPVLIDVIGEAGDSLARRIAELDRMLARSETGQGVSRLLWGLIIGLGVVVIGGGLAWRRSSARNKKAFQVAVDAAAGGGQEAVRSELRRKGFGGQADWLE